MENYKRYKENNPHKTDAQIIESLVWELKDKVETIHRLLAVNEALRKHAVSGSLPCHHNYIQKDTYWKSCTHCGMIAPLGQ